MLGAALARATDAPGHGWHWGPEAHHPQLPRGERVRVGQSGTLEEILFGPGRQADGTLNLIGALKRAMATTGYSDLKELQRIEVVVSPYQPFCPRLPGPRVEPGPARPTRSRLEPGPVRRTGRSGCR